MLMDIFRQSSHQNELRQFTTLPVRHYVGSFRSENRQAFRIDIKSFEICQLSAHPRVFLCEFCWLTNKKAHQRYISIFDDFKSFFYKPKHFIAVFPNPDVM